MQANHRKHQRINTEHPIKATPLIALDSGFNISVFNVTVDAVSLDISEAGIRFCSSYPFAEGAHLSFSFILPDNQKKLSLTGTVKWLAVADEGPFVVGVELKDWQYTDFATWQQAIAIFKKQPEIKVNAEPITSRDLFHV